MNCLCNSPASPLMDLFPELWNTVFSYLTPKELARFDKTYKKAIEITLVGWETLRRKNGGLDLEQMPEKSVKWQAVAGLYFDQYLQERNGIQFRSVIQTQVVYNKYEKISRLFPRLGQFIWRDLTQEGAKIDRTFADPGPLVDKSGDLILEGLSSKNHELVEEAIRLNARGVSYTILRAHHNIDLPYSTVRLDAEHGDYRGMDLFFEQNQRIVASKQDSHFPPVKAQLAKHAPTLEQKELLYDEAIAEYKGSAPRWVIAKAAYTKWQLNKKEEASDLYRIAIPMFKNCTTPWQLRNALHLRDGEEKELHRFYKRIIASYKDKQAVPSDIWAGIGMSKCFAKDWLKARSYFAIVKSPYPGWMSRGLDDIKKFGS